MPFRRLVNLNAHNWYSVLRALIFDVARCLLSEADVSYSNTELVLFVVLAEFKILSHAITCKLIVKM